MTTVDVQEKRRATPPRRRWTWKAWLVQGLAAALVLGAWRYHQLPKDGWHAELKYADYDCSQGEICHFKPHSEGDVVHPAGWSYHATNNGLGFRGKDVPLRREDPSALRVAVFGSSPIYGLGVNDDETFPVVLEKQLRAALPDRTIDVLNFGLPENATGSMLTTYRAFARDFEPDVVVFVNARDISPNDMNYRLVQIHDSELLTELLDFEWGRALINDVQSRSHHFYSAHAAEASVRAKLDVLLRDQRERGLAVIFYNFFDDLGALQRLLPAGLVYGEVTTGMTRADFLATPWVIPNDGHPNAAGHRHFAEVVAPAVINDLRERRKPAK